MIGDLSLIHVTLSSDKWVLIYRSIDEEYKLSLQPFSFAKFLSQINGFPDSASAFLLASLQAHPETLRRNGHLQFRQPSLPVSAKEASSSPLWCDGHNRAGPILPPHPRFLPVRFLVQFSLLSVNWKFKFALIFLLEQNQTATTKYWAFRFCFSLYGLAECPWRNC